jgi:hypothetical protein
MRPKYGDTLIIDSRDRLVCAWRENAARNPAIVSSLQSFRMVRGLVIVVLAEVSADGYCR